MNKKELIEKYPDLVESIAKEFACRVILANNKSSKILWEEFLKENKPKPLFITEDGVEIYKKHIDNHDYIFVLSPDNYISKYKLGLTVLPKDSKFFSTYEAILHHAKVLSYDDVKNYLEHWGNADEKVLEIVEQRLNKQ